MACYDVCSLFLQERIEEYNPFGYQSLFNHFTSDEVKEIELQLNWYDSREELIKLCEIVGEFAETDMTDVRRKELAVKIIYVKGAFPNASIISSYLEEPSLKRLPDYILAKVMEGLIRS